MIPDTLKRAPKRAAVLEFIKAELRAGRTFPTTERVAAHMGWKNTSSAFNCLDNLCRFDRVLNQTWTQGAHTRKGIVYSLKPEFGP